MSLVRHGSSPSAGMVQSKPCVHLGAAVLDADGRQATKLCSTCSGSVRLKVFECHHPAHASDPTTTTKGCKGCKDYQPREVQPRREAKVEAEPKVDMGGIPVAMVAPSQKRPVWMGGIVQIMVTRACDLSCHHCTQGSNLGGKPVVMTPEEFETAVKSLGFGVPGQKPFFGILGVFGGNPALSPHFEAYCEILRGLVPLKQRGLWCNHPRGKGKVMRVTFWPAHSNLNCHLNPEAHAEFSRDWPESIPYLKGMDQDSVHGAPFVAIKDVEPDEAKRWEMIGKCDVNQFWSSLLGVVPGRGLKAYFCELAYAQAALHATAEDAADWPDTGLEATPGWWQKPMADFEAQVRLHCHSCGIPLRRPGQLAIGGEKEEFSQTHAAIAKPKAKGRPVEIVSIGGMIERPDRPSTEYLAGVTPGYHRSQ